MFKRLNRFVFMTMIEVYHPICIAKCRNRADAAQLVYLLNKYKK